MIGVVVPTIAGRERVLARALESLTTTLPAGYRIVIEHGWPTCGQAWNEGARRLLSIAPDIRYLSFWADDLMAMPGWWEPMVESCDDAAVPCAVVLDPNGEVESAGMSFFGFNTDVSVDRQIVEHTLTPFVSRLQWERIRYVPAELHYCTDLWFSALLAPSPVEVRTGARIMHMTHPIGRGAGMDIHERNRVDRDLWHQLVAERRGEA